MVKDVFMFLHLPYRGVVCVCVQHKDTCIVLHGLLSEKEHMLSFLCSERLLCLLLCLYFITIHTQVDLCVVSLKVLIYKFVRICV